MLAQFCVYTIKHSEDLKATQKAGGRGVYSEKRAWVTAEQLLQDAQRSGVRLAIVFGTAEETRDLFAWALLERIEITPDKTTNYTFTGLKLFEGRKRLKSALRKKSNREPLDENFIRPYAICYTPEFLMDSEIGHTPHSAQDVMPNKQRGKEIAKSWGLSVQQALYRKTGDWYHVLTKFPGALLDADGYVIFEREESFKACPQLLIGKDPARHGGWVSASPGIKAIPGYAYVTDRPFVESLLRPSVPARGQTWGGSTEARKAIESHAMDLAVRHYVSLWQEVLDVSATEPFDLLCREGDRELRVEVKGTTSLGLSVFLTRNEVRHAQENNGRVALFVVSNIVADVTGCTGGTILVVEPWDIQNDELEPVAFECRLDARRDHGTQPKRKKTRG